MTLHMTPELDTTAEPVSRLPVFDANMCAEDMERMMDNAQRASNFLKAISHEGLVTPRRDGKAIYYSLTDDRPKQIMEVVYDLFCRQD